MGDVYKAEDTNLDRIVALKFLPMVMTRDKDMKTRFIHEAKTASALDHPNICTIYEIDKTKEEQLFICMGYYEGEIVVCKIVAQLQHTFEIAPRRTLSSHGRIKKLFQKRISKLPI
jgi:serine/threonine protein kinase